MPSKGLDQGLADSVKLKVQRWRHENGYHGKGGVVVVCGDEVQGWVNELRNPEHWRPGCIAVTEGGTCYEALGGNDYDGAKHWRLCVGD
jgi:hypothetical protein